MDEIGRYKRPFLISVDASGRVEKVRAAGYVRDGILQRELEADEIPVGIALRDQPESIALPWLRKTRDAGGDCGPCS